MRQRGQQTVDEATGTRVGVVLPKRMLERLDAVVERENGENRSDVMRRALALYLKGGAK